MKERWKVGELAKLTGLTVRTLRFYDQIGLLSPSDQTESGHRLYGEADLARLHQIVSLKELGLSLDEVKEALAGGALSPVETVRLQMERVRTQIRQQQRLLDQLMHVSKRLQGKAALDVEDFTSLLRAMKTEYEKPVLKRELGWSRQLDGLGEWLAQDQEEEQ